MQSLAGLGQQPHAADSNPQLSFFADRLPRRPYATNNLANGLCVMPAVDALERRYIQANPPAQIFWLPFDIDRPYFEGDWRTKATPNIIVRNPANGHAHLLYGLVAPVTRTSLGRAAPLRFLANISEALRFELDGDPGYSGLICKNPTHGHWQVETPRDALYDLHELAEHVDLVASAKRIRATPKRQLTCLSRNCSLFDSLRTWGYKAYTGHGTGLEINGRGYDGWAAAVLEKARNLNVFTNPLPDSEVRATARSVAKWIWDQYTGTRRAGTTPDDMTPEAFSMLQSSLGKMGNLARHGDNREKRVEAIKMYAGGLTQAQIADELEVSQQTVSRWLKVAD